MEPGHSTETLSATVFHTSQTAWRRTAGISNDGLRGGNAHSITSLFPFTPGRTDHLLSGEHAPHLLMVRH